MYSIPLNNINIFQYLIISRTLVGATGESLSCLFAAALQEVAAPHAVTVGPVLAGGGGVTRLA